MFRPRKDRRRQMRWARLESLEPRALLTTFTVTSLADTVADDGEMTLREAIDAASADDTAFHHDIVFADGLNGTITLQLGEFDLDRYEMPSLTIVGNGQNNTIIDAQHNSDIFSTPYSYSSFSLRSLTLSNSAGNGVENTAAYNWLSLRDTVITVSYTHLTLPTICSV